MNNRPLLDQGGWCDPAPLLELTGEDAIRLEIEHSNLSAQQVASLSQLRNVVHVKLENCQLDNLEWLGQLKCLRRLYLRIGSRHFASCRALVALISPVPGY